jgi:hypothetical protein
MGHKQLISAAIGVGAWLIAAALNIIQGPVLLGWILLAVGATFIAVALLWWAQGPPQSRSTPASTPTPTPQLPAGLEAPEERTFIDVTPRYLTGLFAGLTHLQAAPLTQPFLGKWMTVSGPLGNVLSNRPTISQVTFQHQSPFAPDPDRFTIFMYFDRQAWDEHLAVLQPGTKITVSGRLREFDSITIHLEDCELVEVRPQEQEEQPAPD